MTYICEKCGMAFELYDPDNAIQTVRDFLACPYCGMSEPNLSAMRCESWDEYCTLEAAIKNRNKNRGIIEEVRNKRLQESTETENKGAA